MTPTNKRVATISSANEYIVTRHEIDYHNDPYGGARDEEIRGVYNSLEDANEAAKEDLLREWPKEFFVKYNVTERDGMVRVHAECPEGEVMMVNVTEKNSKRAKVDPTASSSVRHTTEHQATVYVVTRHEIDYHNDRYGGAQDYEIRGVYDSLEDANEAAKQDLLSDWSKEFFVKYNVTEEHGMVCVAAKCPEGEEMTVAVTKETLVRANVDTVENKCVFLVLTRSFGGGELLDGTTTMVEVFATAIAAEHAAEQTVMALTNKKTLADALKDCVQDVDSELFSVRFEMDNTLTKEVAVLKKSVLH